MPQVSFIVAVYNSMPYLTQCLDSLLGQTVKDIEVICVNDCSPDNSAEVIRDYMLRDSRVKLINHTTNKRQGGAWNTGVRAATGNYLCFVDADDWLELDYSEVLLRNEDSGDILLAKQLYEGNNVVFNIDEKRFLSCDKDIRLYMLLYGFFFITNFYKRSLFDDFSFVENNMYHDFMTHLLFFKTDSIFVLEKVGYHYRVDNISTQRSINNQSFWGRMDVARLEYDGYKIITSAQKYNDAIDYHYYVVNYRNTLVRAFWGYTTLDWIKIDQVIKSTKECVPNIRNNPYYSQRFDGLSRVTRLPVTFFECCPKWMVTLLHKMYWLVRRIVRK